ncbi:MAG: hypothetical protein ACQSGP_19595 [Frankia sp.]
MKLSVRGSRDWREFFLLPVVVIAAFFVAGPAAPAAQPSAAVRDGSAARWGPAVRAGGIVAAQARLTTTGDSEHPAVYLILTNTTDRADQLESVVSPDAQSAIWITVRHRHSQEEINNLAQQCGSDPRLVAAGLAALANSGDVHLPAHATVDLAPGVGRLELVHPLHPLRVGDAVTVELWFYRGSYLRLRVPIT